MEVQLYRWRTHIDFKAPYPRVPILKAIEIHTGIDVSEMDEVRYEKLPKVWGLKLTKPWELGN